MSTYIYIYNTHRKSTAVKVVQHIKAEQNPKTKGGIHEPMWLCYCYASDTFREKVFQKDQFPLP